MVIFPNCKINLGLSITEKRNDGFHNLETILYPLTLKDALEIVPSAGGFHFMASGISIPGDPMQNLVIMAYRMIDEVYGIGPVRIHLHKKIPAGAGLGGGSSDGAHTIILLNELFSLHLPLETMEEYARTLGSDCPFFIRNEPVLAHQRGDQFRSVGINLGDYRFLVVKPRININTGEAYSWVNPVKKEIALEEIIKLPPVQWKGKLINDFETPVFARFPILSQIHSKISSMGPVYTSLTGTGSAVYGVFEKDSFRLNKSDFPGCFIWSS